MNSSAPLLPHLAANTTKRMSKISFIKTLKTIKVLWIKALFKMSASFPVEMIGKGHGKNPSNKTIFSFFYVNRIILILIIPFWGTRLKVCCCLELHLICWLPSGQTGFWHKLFARLGLYYEQIELLERQSEELYLFTIDYSPFLNTWAIEALSC